MVKKVVLTIVVLAVGFFVYSSLTNNSQVPGLQNNSVRVTQTPPSTKDSPKTTVMATNLDTPWSLVFLPDKSILVTERPGRIRIIEADGGLDPEPVAMMDKVMEIGEGGLLGIAAHPAFERNHYLYLYYTYSAEGENTLNRVVRVAYENRKIGQEEVIIDSIPGARNHNGGRIKFGPDGYLYVTTGDAQEPSRAQDKNILGGKILRVTDEGKPAPNNPFGNLVYSYGHRNPQGLAWNEGKLYSTEHGRSGALSGLDEFNLIEPGKNYGWPDIQGDQKKQGMVTPLLNSESSTWAPGSLAYLNGAFYFGGLRGSTLYKVTMNGSQPEIAEYFKNEFGRIRDVVAGPDNLLYITTSNQDGRGLPKTEDDRVIRIDPNKL